MAGVVKDDVCRESLLVSEPAIGHTPLLTSNDREMVSLKDEPHSENKENNILEYHGKIFTHLK